MDGVKVLSIEGPDEFGKVSVTITPDSVLFLEDMFPGATSPEDAFRSYWNLATSHVFDDNNILDLQVADAPIDIGAAAQDAPEIINDEINAEIIADLKKLSDTGE